MSRPLPFVLALFLSPFAFAAVGDPPIGAPVETVRVLDAGPSPLPPAPVVIAPLPVGLDPLDDVGALASLAVTAVRTGNWWALAALALSLVVSFVRKFFGEKLPWLSSGRGGFLTVVLLALFGAVATALLGGRAIGVPLLIDALKVALTAAGGFVGFKKIFLSDTKAEEAVVAAHVASPTKGVGGVVGPSKPLGS